MRKISLKDEYKYESCERNKISNIEKIKGQRKEIKQSRKSKSIIGLQKITTNLKVFIR